MSDQPMYEALADYVWVRCDKMDRVTAGGIILPDTADQGKPQQGTVLSVGGGRVLESGEVVPMYLRPGDRVIFGAYAGIEAKLGNDIYLIIRQDDVLLREVTKNGDVQNAGG